MASIAVFGIFPKPLNRRIGGYMSNKFARLWYFIIELVQMWVIFKHLKLWVAVARHNLKWVKIKII